MLTSLIISADQQLVWAVDPVLRELEFEVSVKPTLAEGMEYVRRTRYNTVVVDCANGGAEGLREVRLAPLNRESILIAVTNRAKPEEVAEAGADALWQRPLLPARVFQTLVDARGIATGERRFEPRQQLDRAAFLRYSFNGEEFHESIIVDVTESGVAIESIEPLIAGRALQVQFSLPAMLSPIKAIADIVWRSESGKAGLRFLQMSEAHHRRLERWLRCFRLGMRTSCSCSIS
jgi:PilZ domain